MNLFMIKKWLEYDETGGQEVIPVLFMMYSDDTLLSDSLAIREKEGFLINP